MRKKVAPTNTRWLVLVVTGIMVCFIAFPLLYPAEPDVETRACDIRSPHPYPDNADLAWPVALEGVKRCRVQFSRLEVEEGFDYVILNSSTDLAEFTGNYTEGCWTEWVEGSSFTLRRTSDHITAGWGFRAVAVEVELSPVVWEARRWFLLFFVLVLAGIAVVILVVWWRGCKPP